jgi:hypothetical protein
MLLPQWVYEVIVYSDSPLCMRVKQPNEYYDLKNVVKGDHCEEYASELVHEGHETKDHPVGEPLLVIVRLLRLQCEKTHEAGVHHPNEVCQEGLPETQEH